jgi:hypothetical protein
MNANRMNRVWVVLIALALVALPAAAQKERSGAQRTTPVEPVRNMGAAEVAKSEIFFCQTATTECRTTASAFELKRVRDLFVFVTWPGVLGDHVQTVEFYLPDGNLYARRETPFRIQNAKSRAAQAPGAKVTGEFLSISRGVPTVITPLEVEGTYISQRALTGQWSVRVLLDGNLVAASKFSIDPPQKAN